MSDHIALYNKYRPKRFRQLVGQSETAFSLMKGVQDERVSHAYLFLGPRGTGKTSAARIFAAAMNCDATKEGEPCETCESCESIFNGTSLSVLEYDAATHNGVEAIRDITNQASLATHGRRKVIILDEAHSLTPQAFNALLKTLEEPPPGVTFILATTDPNRIPDTAKSRCQKRRFSLVSTDKMTNLISAIVEHEGLELTEEQIASAITEGAGSVRDTISAVESLIGTETVSHNWSHAVVEALATLSTVDVLKTVSQALQDGSGARSLTEEVFSVLRECFFVQMGATSALTTLDWGKREETAKALGPKRTVKAIELLGESIVGMQQGGDARVALEIALARVCALG